MYQMTCETLNVTDSAVMGAAIMAGVAVGIFENIPDAAKQMIRVDKRFEPIPENAAIYDEMYAIYTSAYEVLAGNGVYDRIAKLQAKY